MDPIYRKALEADRDGDWKQAHELIQDLPTSQAAWIHAYLHRKEGDEWNAKYWYNRAGKDFYNGSLKDEWQFIWQSLE